MSRMHTPALGLLAFSVTGAAACPTVLSSQQESQSKGLQVLHVMYAHQRSESKGLQALRVMSAQPCPGASGLLFHRCCSFTTVLISYQSSESMGLHVMYAQPRAGLPGCSVTESSNMHHCPGLGSALKREEEEAHRYGKHGCTALRWVFWTLPSRVLRHAPPSCSWKRLDTLDPRRQGRGSL